MILYRWRIGCSIDNCANFNTNMSWEHWKNKSVEPALTPGWSFTSNYNETYCPQHTLEFQDTRELTIIKPYPKEPPRND